MEDPECDSVSEGDLSPREYEYSQKLNRLLNTYRRNNQYCDMTLQTTTGEKFSAHRAVLAASSPYFSALFSGSFSDSSCSDYRLDCLKPATADIVLTYLYTGHVDLTYSCLSDILAAAEFLILPNLKQHCKYWIKFNLDPEHVCLVKYLAELYSLEELQSVIDRTLGNLEGKNIFADETLIELPVHFIEGIILDSRLKCMREKDLAEFLLRWVKHDEEERCRYVELLFQHVLWDYVPVGFITENILADKVLQHCTESQAIISLLRHSVEQRCTEKNREVDVLVMVSASPDTPCVGFVPFCDQWVEFTGPPSCLLGKTLKSVCMKGKIYLFVMSNESRAWISSYTQDSGPLPSLHVLQLDVMTNTWSSLSPPSTKSSLYELIPCDDHYIFAFSVSGILDKYSLLDNKWHECARPPSQISYFDTFYFTNGKLLYIISLCGNHKTTSVFKSSNAHPLYMYDPVKDTWNCAQLHLPEGTTAAEIWTKMMRIHVSTRYCPTQLEGDTLILFDSEGFPWCSIHLVNYIITVIHRTVKIPNMIYRGHGRVVTVRDQLYLLNSSDATFAVHDRNTGFCKLLAPCPVRPFMCSRTLCHLQVDKRCLQSLPLLSG